MNIRAAPVSLMFWLSIMNKSEKDDFMINFDKLVNILDTKRVETSRNIKVVFV